MPRICLNMIVKNEAANLPRALASVRDHITCYAIRDTGSTDNTLEVIRSSLNGIPGIVTMGKFTNFSQARNEALDLAREASRDLIPDFDYLLLMDADMELVAAQPLPDYLSAPAYTLEQRAGSLAYFNTRLLSRQAKAEYVGATHEFLSVDGGAANITAWWFKDHATGSNRGNKLVRDTHLLKAELQEQPDNPRTLFYLAQTLKETGKTDKALKLYERHRRASTWDEERFFSMFQMGNIYLARGDARRFRDAMLCCINERPSRPEPYYELAKYHREVGENPLSWMYADAGSQLPPCGDLLFLDTTPTRFGFMHEKSIVGFYQDWTRDEGFRCANKLALQIDAPPSERAQARQNLMHYIKPIGQLAPSWKALPIPFTPPKPGYTAMNPSIAVTSSGLILALVRTVNYVIRSDGSYDMQGDDAIRTTNYIVPLDGALHAAGEPVEIQRADALPPPAFPPVQGYEDARLIATNTGLYISANLREQNEEGYCEQWLTNVNSDGRCTHIGHMPAPKRYGRQHEKNWMPIVDRMQFLFMYRPNVVVGATGNIVSDKAVSITTDSLSGGSQLIPWETGWLGIVHEALMDPAHGYSKRYYQHRAVWYDHEFVLQKVSPPFWFEQRQIEFCAGLARHPTENSFLITYSTNDASAKIGRIAFDDMRSLLWAV